MNKFAKGMLVGATVGAAISLLDKETRKMVIHHTKRATLAVRELVNDREEILYKAQETVHNVRTTVEHMMEDVTFLLGHAEKWKETAEGGIEIVKGTSEVASSEERVIEE